MEELLQSRWLNGELASQREKEMELTCDFKRRESVFVSNAHRRSVALGGRQSILPVITEAPRKSILRKSIAPLPPLNNSSVFDVQPTTSRASAVSAVDVSAAKKKRKSLECVTDQEMKSPPHFRRKFDEFEEHTANGMSKLEIFHDDKETAAKDDKDLFKTPSLPPAARPRASSVYDLGDDNEGCTTQTFNFFIKSQSVSTPKTTEKPARLPSCDNQQRCILFAENENPAPSNADLEALPATTARQPFATRMPPDEMPSPNYPSPEMELNRHKLSAILETTEDTNTMSSAATISSKSSSVSVDELRTIYEANSNIDSITSTTATAANKSSPLATIDEIELVDKTSVAESETRLSSRNKGNAGSHYDPQPKCNKAETPAVLPFEIFEDNLAHYVTGLSVSKAINDEAPSMCAMNLIEEKTETIPLFLMNRNQTAEASAMAPFAEPTITLPFTIPPLDESTEQLAAPKTKTFDRSNFAIFEDDAVSLLCPVNDAVDELKPNVNETANKSVFNFGSEQSLLLPPEPLKASIKAMNDSNWSDSVSKLNLSARPTLPIDEIDPPIASIHSVVDRSKFNIFQDESDKTMPHAIDDAASVKLNPAPFPIFTDQSIFETKNNTLQMSKNTEKSTSASSEKIFQTVTAVAQPVISTAMTDIDEEYYRMIQSPDMRCSKQSMINKTDVRAPVTNDRSASLVNSMKEISLTEHKVDRNAAQLQPQQTIPLEKFSFSEDCPNTELFSLHMASIKNSTLLERAPSPLPPTLDVPQSGAEAASQAKTLTTLNDEYFASIKSPIPTIRCQSLNPEKNLAESRPQEKKCTSFDDEFYALINSPIPPMPPTSSQMVSLSESNAIYNISGIELNDTEMKLMRKDFGECTADLSFPKIQISEPKTIRPSAFNRMTAHFTIPDSPEIENTRSSDQAKHNIEDRSVFIVETTEDLAAAAKQCKQEQSSFNMSGTSFRRGTQFSCERKGSISIDYSQSQHIDPFDLNVQHAFLSDIDFVDYISKLDNVFMVNRVRALQPDTEIAFGDKEFHIVEQIGRGSFGFVYRCVCIPRRS